MQTVLSLRGNYHEFEIPDGVLYLTAFVDVQKGSEKDPDYPARLEMEVLGHGMGYRTWSITYQIFRGSVDSAFDGAFQSLVEWFSAGHGTFHRGALDFPISLMFIDCGYNPEVVYQFCTRGPGMWPCKGMPVIIADAKRREVGDIPGGFKYYRLAQVSGGQWIYEVNTQLYKKGIYGELARSGAANREPGGVQRPGFADFPAEYTDDYFRGLAAEEMLLDGTFQQVHAHNEPLDCRVGAKAAGHVYLDMLVKAAQDYAKRQGANEYQLKAIGARQALDLLTARLSVPQK